MFAKDQSLFAHNDSLFHHKRPSVVHDVQDDDLELRGLTGQGKYDRIAEDDPVSPGGLQTEIATSPKAPKHLFAKYLGPRFSGWRFGALNFAIWASAVFLINLVVTIRSSAVGEAGVGVLVEDDCAYIRKLNTAVHACINILGTILLAGSNYCMQTLSAPTRSEVSRAHSAGIWLDIGVPGVRNLRHISKQRLTLWVLLGISSLPLHLFYNSAVFASLSSSSYSVFSVSESFLTDTECLNCTSSKSRSHRLSNPDHVTVLETLWDQGKQGDLTRLEPAECMQEYAQIIQSRWGSLLLVAADSNFPPPEQNSYLNNSRVYWAAEFTAINAQSTLWADNAYEWICSGTAYPVREKCAAHLEEIRSRTEQWRVGGVHDYYDIKCDGGCWPVEYCLSERIKPHCKLHFELSIAIMIMVMNFVKAALMFYISFLDHEEPLMTMGDAVASFLRHNDPSTRYMSLVSYPDLQQAKDYTPGARPWKIVQYWWKDAASKTRRTVIIVLFAIALLIVTALLAVGLNGMTMKSKITGVGFGAVDPRTAIVGMPQTLIFNAFVANFPQLILTFLYFSYNALFTAMLMCHEWTSYALKSKGLRVSSNPTGAQRSTYFLQLPYRFGVPLLILSGTLHWLVSQSIFLIAIEYYDALDRPGVPNYSQNGETMGYTTLGFSPSAIITVIAFGLLMIASIVVIGYAPYQRGMPLAGSCSMAISAACHVEEDGVGAAEGKLRWGVVSVDGDGVGHCAFSAREVTAPVEGALYA